VSIRKAAIRRTVLVLATVVAVFAVAAGPVFAAADIGGFPAAGAVFTCGSTQYTATSGFVKTIMNETTTPSGNMSITGTLVPMDVTLTGPNGETYSLQGASWFGGLYNSQTGTLLQTETDMFTITSPSTGVVGSVNMVAHMSPDGSTISFNFGTCTPPAG
jgi:predicted signal transduction protein with EAL and GGDEF domain